MAPPADSAAAAAFRAYANYDGAGSRFAGTLVPVTTTHGVSVFAARRADKVVLVTVNQSGTDAVTEALDLSRCGAVQNVRSFGIEQAEGGLIPADHRAAYDAAGVTLTMPPYSVTTVEATLVAR